MARAYTVATAALALQVPTKWVDNILSHHQVQGVIQARQGIARRLSVESLIVLTVALLLVHDLALPTANAISIAAQLVQARGTTTLPSGIHLQIDIDRVTRHLLERLESAVEVAPLPRRGRPPQKTTGRLD